MASPVPVTGTEDGATSTEDLADIDMVMERALENVRQARQAAKHHVATAEHGEHTAKRKAEQAEIEAAQANRRLAEFETYVVNVKHLALGAMNDDEDPSWYDMGTIGENRVKKVIAGEFVEGQPRSGDGLLWFRIN